MDATFTECFWKEPGGTQPNTSLPIVALRNCFLISQWFGCIQFPIERLQRLEFIIARFIRFLFFKLLWLGGFSSWNFKHNRTFDQFCHVYWNVIGFAIKCMDKGWCCRLLSFTLLINKINKEKTKYKKKKKKKLKFKLIFLIWLVPIKINKIKIVKNKGKNKK